MGGWADPGEGRVTTLLQKRVCDRTCKGCIYFGVVGDYGCCNYIFMADKRRPCPPGKGCTVKVALKRKRKERGKRKA